MDIRPATTLGTVRRNLRRRLGVDIQVTPAPSGVRFDHDVPVVVRDGTTLRANVFRPEADGRYPVLLCAATYGKDRFPQNTRSGRRKPVQYRLAANDAPITFSAWTALGAPDPAFWVPRGYVLVDVDLRGWGTSAGAPEPFGPTEGDDVHDAIEWSAAQPWSNGRIGMTGVSYLAISQWSAAATRPPHLAAINPWEGFTDAYRDFACPGGIRENGFMVMWSTWQRLMRPRSPSFRRGQTHHPLRDGWWEQRSPDLERFELTYGDRYPGIVAVWRAAWERFIPVLAYPAVIRRIVYTTNMVESVNYQMRKASKTRGHFPDDDSALKLLRLIARDITTSRGGVAGTGTQGWAEVLNAFAIHFPERLNIC
jgi:predicted acyl esterase